MREATTPLVTREIAASPIVGNVALGVSGKASPVPKAAAVGKAKLWSSTKIRSVVGRIASAAAAAPAGIKRAWPGRSAMSR